MIKNILFVNFIFLMVVATYSLTVDEVLDKMEGNEDPLTSYMEITQTVIKGDGRKSLSKIKSYSMDKNDKGISIYTSPARIKGMKMLILNDGDDIWFYSPRTARVRKIASHQKNQSVNGSDFSYEDMSMKDHRKDYNCTLAGNEKKGGNECYKIEMKAKTDDKIYKKIIFWVDKNNYVPVEAHFFDEGGELWKKMFMKNVVKLSKYWTPKYIEMQNVLKGSKTIMEMSKIEYDIKVDETMFSERYLKK